MKNNPQIKVKEAPGDWLVLDYHVPSGNVEFTNLKRNFCLYCEEFMEENYRFNGCCNCNDLLVHEFFGTKHIQLIAANPVHLAFIESQQAWEEARKYQKGNKEFFVYRVSEEK